MLVLTRKMGERIIIGDNIIVTVVRVDHGKVRLGVEAPANIPVYREELVTADSNHQESPQPARARTSGEVPLRHIG
jgi:carbon storage regulator